MASSLFATPPRRTGMAVPNKFGFQQSLIPKPSFQQAYPASVQQAGEDYTGIMSGFKGIAESESPFAGLKQQYTGMLQRPIISPQNFTPESVVYQRSPELMEGFNKLRTLSTTGGYAPEELSSLRERGISPIRSIYANAMRNLDRNRVLSGGYSPNYGAVSSRMARDLSEQIAGTTTKVNADIAERVAAGRQAAIPQFAALAEREAGAARDVNARNVSERNRANEGNITRRMEADRTNAGRESEVLNALERIEGAEANRKLQALEAMRALYGTTPALAQLFGQQALGAAELQQREDANTMQAGVGLTGNYVRNIPPPIIPRPPLPFKQTGSGPPLMNKIGYMNRLRGRG